MNKETTENKIDIKSLTLAELTETLIKLGLPKFRAGQVYRWLHEKQAVSFNEMTNLSAALRSDLDKLFYITVLTVEQKLNSKLDGTVKYLLGLGDDNAVEVVLMRYKHGNSLCISTQVGCRMGCKFCASTLGGLVRNLTAGEMLEEVYAVMRDTGEKISSLVLMGIGEPLDNFENVLGFLELLSSAEGLNLSLRHVSLSTCGIVPQIRKLMEKKLQLTLSISLHATNNTMRSQTMPINQKYNMEELLLVCREYFAYTGRRISFEYALIDGVNDSAADAKELARLLRGMPCHVNLIPINPVRERNYRRSSKTNVSDFQKLLENLGINATIRRELGADINAACGQLRLNSIVGGTQTHDNR